MADPNSNIEELGLVVSGDPRLTESVLKLVNTEFFGLTGKIDCISRAVSLLGIGQLFTLVLDTFESGALEMAENQAYVECNYTNYRPSALV